MLGVDLLADMLLKSFVAVASALGDKITGDFGDATLRGVKGKLAAWGRLQSRAYAKAFEKAVRDARAELNRTNNKAALINDALALLKNESAEGRIFCEIAIEELVLSVRPNIGRLVDHYRRHLRHTAALRGTPSADLSEFEPILRVFLSELLPKALEEGDLRELFLERSDLLALDAARAAADADEDSARTLRRIEVLLQELQQTAVRGSLDGRNISAEAIATLYHSYREYIVEQYGRLDFRGVLPLDRAIPLRLQEIYVPLYCQPWIIGFRELHGQHLSTALPANTQGKQGNSVTSSRSLVHDVVRDKPFLVILGDPGAGKSTLVRYLLVSLVQGQGRQWLGLHGEWLPILFPVAMFAAARTEQRNHNLAPLDYLSSSDSRQRNYIPLFRQALIAGRALVLFDGLDEIRGDSLPIVRCLEAFVREWNASGNRFIATSRIAGYDDVPLDDTLFVRRTITPLDDNQIRQLIERWSRLFESAEVRDLPETPSLTEVELERRVKARVQSLSETVFANSNIVDLARNPLLLSILAQLHNKGIRVPDRRIDLYRLYVKILVKILAQDWNRARSLSEKGVDVKLEGKVVDAKFIHAVLGPVALWMHEEQTGSIVEEYDLKRKLADVLVGTYNYGLGEAQDLAEELIKLVHRDTGLLQEIGKECYSFLHQTFEEYLAAHAILQSVMIRERRDDIILAHCTDPGWREVLRLAVASAPMREAEHLLQLLLQAPTTTETRGQPALLAAECLLDIGRDRVPAASTRVVFDHLAMVLNDPTASRSTRIESSQMLERLNNPHLLDWRNGDSVNRTYWCAIESGSFWRGGHRQVPLPHPFRIGRYLVTNSEFRHFIDDDGYHHDRAWWTEQGRKFLKAGGHSYPWENNTCSISQPRLWDKPEYISFSQPVIGISWYEAVAYCAWLTMQGHREGWLPIDAEIRLPTSLEWERAARHNDRRVFPWGNTKPSVEHANFKETSIGVPSLVGCFPAGAAMCGAVDLAGNVWEWTATLLSKINDQGPRRDTLDYETVAIHGGSFIDDAEQLRCEVREGNIVGNRYKFTGFRIVWSPIGR